MALVLAIAAAAAAVPFLPAGPDLYVHLLWTWQVMRCAAAGDLPVWLPDLNGGFGSPGIRLYSPLGPVLQGVLGLALGSAGAALRVAPVLAWGAFLLVARRVRGGRAGTAEWALLALSPLALHSLLGRGAWSEYLAIPLLWWLLDAAVGGTFRPVRDGTVLACLWLLHAPTTLMAGALLAGAAVLRRDLRTARALALGGAFAAALTAWHWLPLLDEMRLIDRTALTGGIFEITRNVLGSPSAFALDESIWLGWCAVSLLAALLAGRWWRADRVRAALVLACVALASPAALWLYRLPLPLDILQFPWRWLLPAAVLAAAPAARGLAGTPGRARRGAAAGAARAAAAAGVRPRSPPRHDHRGSRCRRAGVALARRQPAAGRRDAEPPGVVPVADGEPRTLRATARARRARRDGVARRRVGAVPAGRLDLVGGRGDRRAAGAGLPVLAGHGGRQPGRRSRREV